MNTKILIPLLIIASCFTVIILIEAIRAFLDGNIPKAVIFGIGGLISAYFNISSWIKIKRLK